MSYPGGKAGAGVYQAIINEIPPHRTYIEPFAGGAAVLRKLRPAERRIAVDRSSSIPALPDGVEFHQGCGVEFLASYPWTGREFVFCDPPYLFDVRLSGRAIYECEFGQLEEHSRLLAVLQRLPCPVMLCGYPSPLYAERLATWRTKTYTVQTRGGPVRETLWMNYEPPNALHDYRYLGDDFRERERIKRKVDRFVAKIGSLNERERRALLSAVSDLAPPVAVVPTAASPELPSLEHSDERRGESPASPELPSLEHSDERRGESPASPEPAGSADCGSSRHA